ncbi:MAG: MBOAT family O-acyltransferase [Ruminococcus callidus]
MSADDLSIGFGRIAVGLGKRSYWQTGSRHRRPVPGKRLHHPDHTGCLVRCNSLRPANVLRFLRLFRYGTGIARIFGFHLDENFRHPFLCKDITEFWQRWHISLGTFFRDYLLYVPLFGKRRKIGGLLLVWFCTGLWHGASWNYIIWGIYYGLFLMLEMGIGKKGMKKIPAVLRHLCNKIVIIVGFGIFYCTGGIDQLGICCWQWQDRTAPAGWTPCWSLLCRTTCSC